MSAKTVESAVANPYLTEFLATSTRPCPSNDDGPLALLSWQSSSSYSRRQELVNRYSWAIPNDEAIAAIAALSPIVEIGAGTGYWASLLAKAGADVLAFDKKPPSAGGNYYHDGAHEFVGVAHGGPEVLVGLTRPTLFLCWPPYKDAMATECLALYEGETVAYIGESAGGCTGSGGFHEALEAGWDLVREVDLPQWPGIHDCLMIYRRKSKG